MEEIKPGIYRHYKGNEYKIIGTGYHSETLEKLVFYESLYDSSDFPKGTFWARPIKMFVENVKVGHTEVPRFIFVSENE